MNRFPKDCWGKNCPHFHTVDMSIDDLLCACDILQKECDACDEDFLFPDLPIEQAPAGGRGGRMKTCDNCACDPVCDHNWNGWEWNGWETCRNWIQKPGEPPTNADRIRAMSDEELSEWLCQALDCDFCKAYLQNMSIYSCCENQVKGIFDWLQSPAEEDT